VSLAKGVKNAFIHGLYGARIYVDIGSYYDHLVVNGKAFEWSPSLSTKAKSASPPTMPGREKRHTNNNISGAEGQACNVEDRVVVFGNPDDGVNEPLHGLDDLRDDHHDPFGNIGGTCWSRSSPLPFHMSLERVPNCAVASLLFSRMA
jgi:hypothetical protein